MLDLGSILIKSSCFSHTKSIIKPLFAYLIHNSLFLILTLKNLPRSTQINQSLTDDVTNLDFI